MIRSKLFVAALIFVGAADYLLAQELHSPVIKGTADFTGATVLGLPGGAGSTGPTGAGYSPATSSTNFTTTIGSQTLTTQAGLAYQVGARVRVSWSVTPADYVEGLVTSYSGTTLVMNVDTIGGTPGTWNSWLINLAGQPGTAGSTGAAGPTGATGATGTGGASFNQTIQNATTPLTQRPAVNFTGTGVSCVDNSGATRTDCTITAGSGGYGILQNNGTPVTARTTLNLINGGCVDNAGLSKTDCTFSGSGGASMFTGLGDLAVTLASNILTVGANCSSSFPCNVANGGVVTSFTSQATIQSPAGGCTFLRVGIDFSVSPATLRVLCNAGSTTVAGMAVTQAVASAFDPNMGALFTETVTGTNFDTTAGSIVDYRASMRFQTIIGGTGISLTRSPSDGSVTVAIDTSVIPVYLTATAALTFGSIAASGGCGEQNITVTGASATNTNPVSLGLPAAFTAGLTAPFGRVSAADTVTIRICNATTGAITPTAAATYRVTVLQ